LVPTAESDIYNYIHNTVSHCCWTVPQYRLLRDKKCMEIYKCLNIKYLIPILPINTSVNVYTHYFEMFQYFSKFFYIIVLYNIINSKQHFWKKFNFLLFLLLWFFKFLLFLITQYIFFISISKAKYYLEYFYLQISSYGQVVC